MILLGPVLLDRDRENHDNQRHDTILRFLSARRSDKFLHIFGGDFLTKVHRKPGERGKIPLEKIQNLSEDGAPKLQISVPCRGRTCPELTMQDLFVVIGRR